jgi:predicted lipoprotein with Yx(FWY)xxD motif
MLVDTTLGKVLADASGHTLYQRDGDTATTVTCTGACTSIWPPLVATGTPKAGTGLDPTKLAVVSGANGTQVTYGGHPLYTYAADRAAGEVNGQGFAGVWFVVGADGQKIAGAAAAATPPPTEAPPPMTDAPQTIPPETSPPTEPPPPAPTEPPPTMSPYPYKY